MSGARPALPGSSGSIDYALALVLAMLAGAVDAVGVVHWRGLFVSFMSGNSTIFGAATARLDGISAAVSLEVIGAFVIGVAAGELLAALSGRRGRPLVLLVEAMLLATGGALSISGCSELVFAPMLSAAMGVQNASVYRAGGIGIALTYVTGTLVHIGRGIAAALRGAGAWSAPLPFLGVWSALVAGAAGGALLTMRSEAWTLGGAAAIALLLSGITLALNTSRPVSA